MQERLFTVTSSHVRVQLWCRGERLPGDAALGSVEEGRWRPRNPSCDLLQLDMTWDGAATPSPPREPALARSPPHHRSVPPE